MAMHPQNHHLLQDSERIHHPLKVFLCHFVGPPGPQCPKATTELLSVNRLVLHFLECSIKGLTQYASLVTWLLSLSFTTLRFLHGVPCIDN